MRKSKALKHKDYLTLLSKAKKATRRRRLVELADPEEIHAISECILNVLSGNVHLKPQEKRKLKRHREALRHIARKRNSAKSKKKVLQQKGGFLSAVLPLALSALTSVVPALFGK